MAYGIVSANPPFQATSNIYLEDVTDAAATGSDKQISLVWSDPEKVELDGATLARWDKTLVVRKAGSAPNSYTDGTVIVTNTVKDQYKTTPFVDTGLTNGTIYYYRFFPVSKDGAYTDGGIISAKPSAVTIPIPTITSTHTYTGQSQTPTISGFDSNIMTKSGDESGTNAGDYNLVVALGSGDYIWSNGQYTPQTVPWTIEKGAGGIALSKAATRLNNKFTSRTITITQAEDGELSVENTDPTIASGVIIGNNLIISRVGTNVGTCQMTVKAAESNNYTAAQAEIVVTANNSNYNYMTVKIDESNSNPETCCTYDDDAVNMEPGSAGWDTFFGHYPCLFKNGVEGVKLNPNNFDQDINGNTVDISSGDSGDAMVAFPKRGLRMSKSGTVVTITMTDDPDDDEDFEYMAHRRGDTLKDKFYIGVYMGSEVDSKLRSLKGIKPISYKTIGDFRTLARANNPASDGSGGSGYDQHGWYQLIYLQAMYVLKYKNLDSQTVIGMGVVTASGSADARAKTGGTETKGMDWGTDDNTLSMKLFGIEDLWGNLGSYIDGIWSDADRKIWTATENFNDTGSGYTDRGASGLTENKGNYLSKIQGDTHKAFLVGSDSGVSGSTTTYYTDGSWLQASRMGSFPGCYSSNNLTGMFNFALTINKTHVTYEVGSRLMYL